ncbi:heparinase II/III family protein [Syntrophorhabdus aromaticivorans]|uniref:heparinase II/III family protein n=1 Tax=Syntrophorhabdus aromaticivorans TaxID=328301 RepID=UPI0003FE1A81|nr:alginate lyase family protein [Syntrophorhabdus aromaticivorans]
MNSSAFRRLFFSARYLGPSWLAFRLKYGVLQKSGLLEKKMPLGNWGAHRDSSKESSRSYGRFFFSPASRSDFQPLLNSFDNEVEPQGVIYEAENIKQGIFSHFSHNHINTGFPPPWNVNAVTNEFAPLDRHWSKIGDFSSGDIKLIWELSRFSFVYTLVRAYWRTGDESYPELFWRLLEDWRLKNQPNLGPNWKCGQETAFRVMAWIFGLYGFFNASATTLQRVALLAQMIAVCGQRIAGNIGYALSQNNNHGISEALGLWTIGLLFPELRNAERWREKGRRYLEEQGKSLIYEDGSFSQHSVNYHRLMLHDYLWAFRLGDLHKQALSEELMDRVAKAAEWLYQLQDEKTGCVPYYGQNDGTLVLPLNNCDYLDFRPVTQAAHYYFTGERLFDDGPWDEDLLWLFGPGALSVPVRARERKDFSARNGGYYTLRTDTGFAFTRCATFLDRPGQADMLHVDLWWRGQNIALDAGTYSYNAPEPWNNPLAHTTYHNTVTVDGRDQMDRAGKFLWLPWLKGKARCIKRSSTGHLAYWEGGHDGYRRLSSPVDHHRGILQLGEESWLVVDRLSGAIAHRYRLHWLLPDYKYLWDESVGLLTLLTEAGDYYLQTGVQPQNGFYTLVRADKDSPRGWRAPYYSYREPALSLDLTVNSSRAFFWTLFSPAPCHMEESENRMILKLSTWQADVLLSPHGAFPLIANANLSGNPTDKLELI